MDIIDLRNDSFANIIEKDERFDSIFGSFSSRPRLLYVVEAMGGGVFTYIVELVNSLINDYDIYLAYGIRPQTPANYKEYFDPRVKLCFIENFTRAINLNKDVRAFFEIKKLAKTVKPNIVHLHSSKAGVLGRLLFGFSDIPLFYTPHGYSFIMKDASPLKSFIYKSIEKICALFNCTTVSCSAGENEETLKLTKRAVDIDNGININELESMVATLSKNCEEIDRDGYEYVVFTLGRINSQKNPSLFNEVAKSLPNVKFVWIGDGPLRNELTAPNISITGWKSRKEAFAISLSCDVFMLTSLWEGLPLALLEAMYMKKPVVVSNVIGNNDVVKNKINGYVCNDVNEFAFAIMDTDNHAKYVENAYYEVVEHYNINNMKQKYSALYNESLFNGTREFKKKIYKYHVLEEEMRMVN